MNELEKNKQEMILQLLILIANHTFPVETVKTICNNYGFYEDYQNLKKNMVIKT